MNVFWPEGCLIDNPDNKRHLSSLRLMEEAKAQSTVLEGRVSLCDSEHNLVVDLGICKGVIPREEGALGIKEGYIKDIALISKVNKPISFIITGFSKDGGNTYPILSRRLVQEKCQNDYLNRLAFGDIIPGRITHLEAFGAFVDIGAGIASLLPIDAISVSRISHPSDRFYAGQMIRAVVKSRDSANRILLTHKELLGTWEENAAMFSAGETVSGIVRSVESYGVFVELTPNLAGLAEPKEGVYCGMHASVYIKNLIPDKMKVKLIIVDAFDANYRIPPYDYFIQESHIDKFTYSPPYCERKIETLF